MKRRTSLIILLFIAIAVVFAVLNRETSGARVVSVQTAHEMIINDPSVVVLDVRTEAEYRSETGHLANAILIPGQELERRIGELAPFKGKEIIAYCRSGKRSGKAAAFLTERGFNVANMEGGIVKWTEERLPVVKEKSE